MASSHPAFSPELSTDDWRRIRDALRYLARDLHHRSFAVSDDRRRLLWEEMDHCLALAERLPVDRGDGDGAGATSGRTDSPG